MADCSAGSIGPLRKPVALARMAFTPTTLLLCFRRVPKLDRLIRTSGGQKLAICTERQAQNFAGMPFEGGKSLTPGHVPKSDRSILRTGSQRLAVGAEGHRPHICGVSFEGDLCLACSYFPQRDAVVAVARRGQGLDVRTERCRCSVEFIGSFSHARTLAGGH